MNRINGQIDHVEIHDKLSMVYVSSGDVHLQAIIIDTPASNTNLKVGNAVSMVFKETEVIIGTSNLGQISLRNQLPGTVTDVEKGKLLSKITMNTTVGDIRAIISTKAAEELQLEKGTQAVAMVKTNEVMLAYD